MAYIHKNPASDLGHVVAYIITVGFSIISFLLVGDFICSLLLGLGAKLGLSAYLSPIRSISTRLKATTGLLGGFVGSIIGYYSKFGDIAVGGLLSGNPYAIIFWMGFLTFFGVVTYNYFTSGRLIR